MLLRFRIENHASLRDEQELSLVALAQHSGRAEGMVSGADKLSTTPVVAIYGPNASGKSNVIDAIMWARHVVLSSYRSWDPTGGVARRPYRFRPEPGSTPTEAQFDFVVDDVRYAFGFSVDDDKICREWLYHFPEGRSNRLYDRDENGEVVFGRSLKGRRKTIADSLRQNSLFLSVAAAQGHQQLSRIFRWFRFDLIGANDADFQRRVDHTLHIILKSDVHDAEARAATLLLSYADLGAAALQAKELDEADTEELQRVRRALQETAGDRVALESSKFKHVTVVHHTTEGEYTLPIGEESSGTQTWVGLLGVVISTLVRGGILCVDELDARLHPQLVDALVGMFQSAEVNQRGAQLIFSSHDVTLLGREARTELYRDQIWLTEKDPETLATRLFPLTEFRVRDNVDNMERKYLLGRYGAIPYLDEGFPHRLAGILEREEPDAGKETAQAGAGTDTGGASSFSGLL